MAPQKKGEYAMILLGIALAAVVVVTIVVIAVMERKNK